MPQNNLSVSSLSSFDVYLIRDDASSCCTSSTETLEKRWEPVKAPDARPIFPTRQRSRPSLTQQESELTLGTSEHSRQSIVSEKSAATCGSDPDLECSRLTKRAGRLEVGRSLSNDCLPQMPRRQMSRKHLIPPPLPRRQSSSGNVMSKKNMPAKTNSLPDRPCRYPSREGRA